MRMLIQGGDAEKRFAEQKAEGRDQEKMTILRAGLYERVSTDEQVKYGYSIRTQIDDLEEYCMKNKIKIVDHYCDEGVSGGKAAFKRPEMSRLLDDVKAGRIDIIIFTRLDRWFRNVPEYFKVQELLDEHGVQWKAIYEDYDTTTSNGRMAITIFLAIAQSEREKTAERLAVVFDNKRQRKEAWFGWSSMPFGYTKALDADGIPRLVKDPELKDAMQDFWDIAVKFDNVSKAAKYVNRTYGLNRSKKLWFDVIHNEIYTGRCRDVEDYCEPYVSREDWERMQNRGTIKKTQANRVYLFTGMIKCPECGSTMVSQYSCPRKGGKEYKGYRCRHKDINTCQNRRTVSEKKVETWLLENIEKLFEGEVARVELERNKPKPKPKVNVPALREQLRRLEVVYMSGNKSDAEYIAESNDIKAQIAKAESETSDDPNEPDLDALKQILEKDFRSIYEYLNEEEKRRFWRSIIREIHVRGNDPVSVDFL